MDLGSDKEDPTKDGFGVSSTLGGKGQDRDPTRFL
jgi:hypothetical protein